MRLVKTLQILGSKYKVKWHKGYVKWGDAWYAGLCVVENKHIDVSLKENYAATLLHEIIHAVIHEAALNQCKISHDAKEIICEQVSRVIDANFRLVPRGK